MTLLPIVLSTVLALLAAAHAWWAMGRIWPSASEPELARAVIGDGRIRMPAPWQCAAVAMVLTIVASPLFEEFLFRGLIYGNLRRFQSRSRAALMSTVVFAIFHPPAALIPRTHEPSHGAGQTRPVNSGKLFVA